MTTIIITLLVFGVIITLHELGHFLFAKAFNVRVHEFAFGMGPKLFSKQKGETLYSIRAFPIGGYVAMEGENGTEEEYVGDGRAFFEKKLYQRFLILVAGAAMNIILGFAILFVVTLNMDIVGTNYVSEVSEQAPFVGQLQSGEQILKVNNHTTNNYNDVVFQILRDADGVIDFVTMPLEGGEKVSKQITFNMTQVEGTDTNMVELDMLFYGIEPTFWQSVEYSFNWTISVAKQVWFSLIDIVTGRYGVNELSGPVGTATVIEEASSMGLQSLMVLVAFITINVGVFNMLPLPALDGGRILFLIIEMILRKPVPQRFEAIVHASGMVLLLSFVVFVTFNDIMRLFQ